MYYYLTIKNMVTFLQLPFANEQTFLTQLGLSYCQGPSPVSAYIKVRLYQDWELTVNDPVVNSVDKMKTDYKKETL